MSLTISFRESWSRHGCRACKIFGVFGPPARYHIALTRQRSAHVITRTLPHHPVKEVAGMRDTPCNGAENFFTVHRRSLGGNVDSRRNALF